MIPGKEEIVSILKSIKDPETEISLFDLGLVKHIDFQESTEKMVINIDFRRRNPSCAGCIPIAWLVQKRITDELSSKLMEFSGVKSVEYVDK